MEGVGRRRLVLLPSPFEGHLNPMLQLATVLHGRGFFTITILHTQFNSPDPSKYPTSFHFIPIPDRLPDELTCGEDYMVFLIALNANCEGPFHRQIVELMEEGPTIACLVVDAQLYFMRRVAEELQLPRIVLRTSSAASFNIFAAVPDLRNKGFYPIHDDQRETLVPDLAPFREKDLPHFKKSTPTSVLEVLNQIISGTRASSGVVMNTFEALEAKELEQLRNTLNLPVTPIGPLHKLCPNFSSRTRLIGDRSCMEWLDEQRPRSVLYVSFGSLACMDGKEMVEMARGLVDSQQPFLWVIRPGSIRAGPSKAVLALPEEFEEETSGRGRILQWAPQQEVLRHRAVGGFWTHCGWNSVLESVCEGVPMICRPCFGDQLGNARVVSHIWKVGIQLEDGVERGQIARAIRALMVEKDGDEMRERARQIKFDADRCIGDGGPFHASLDRLVHQILSL